MPTRREAPSQFRSGRGWVAHPAHTTPRAATSSVRCELTPSPLCSGPCTTSASQRQHVPPRHARTPRRFRRAPTHRHLQMHRHPSARRGQETSSCASNEHSGRQGNAWALCEPMREASQETDLAPNRHEARESSRSQLGSRWRGQPNPRPRRDEPRPRPGPRPRDKIKYPARCGTA